MPDAIQPQVIFLDAVGTLFGVATSVGEIYGDLARHHGIDADSTSLNQAFFRAFKAAPGMVFPDSNPTMVPQQEYQWWRLVVQQTFSSAGMIDSFVDFDSFFADLYAHFATAAPWQVYPDVANALQRWQRRGIELGIISNFDSRLHGVLKALNLDHYFSSVTISSEAGAAKPDPLIFATALQKHRCAASDAWHIGDSKIDDVAGAKAAGIRGIWINRTGY